MLWWSLGVVLSGTRFLLFWRKKVLSNWFWHFFTNFSIFHEFSPEIRHFCGARHGFVAYAALQLKSVRSPQNDEFLEKFVKNRRNSWKNCQISWSTFFRQKRRNLSPRQSNTLKISFFKSGCPQKKFGFQFELNNPMTLIHNTYNIIYCLK